MSQPEISRRCLRCGASVRAGSRFCPQCGAPAVVEESPESSAHGDGGEAPAITTDVVKESFSSWESDNLSPHLKPMRDVEVGGSTPERGGGDEADAMRSASGSDAPPPAPPPQLPPARDEMMSRQQSPRPAAPKQPLRRRTVAVVEEKLRPRVERVRDASVSMLDEASEDSGLTFIIIAVAMFLLFLLFLLLSGLLD